MKNDYELYLFSHAMETLVSASQLQLDPCAKNIWRKSIGVGGYGNIGDFNTLADALNYKGFRTKTGRKISGGYLRNIKKKLIERYGEEFVMNIVEWERVNISPIDEYLMAQNAKNDFGITRTEKRNGSLEL